MVPLDPRERHACLTTCRSPLRRLRVIILIVLLVYVYATVLAVVGYNMSSIPMAVLAQRRRSTGVTARERRAAPTSRPGALQTRRPGVAGRVVPVRATSPLGRDLVYWAQDHSADDSSRPVYGRYRDGRDRIASAHVVPSRNRPAPACQDGVPGWLRGRFQQAINRRSTPRRAME
jgi:hypothetical protein